MKRIPSFEQFLYEFEAPYDILLTSREIAFTAPYRINQYNFTTDDFSTRHLPGMISIRRWVDRCLDEVRRDLQFECEEIKTTIEWFNKSEKGMWHQAHTHDNSFLSGVFYLTPSDAETWFSIESVFGPKYTLLNLIHPDNHYIFYKYPTTVGKMLVFPSKLLHSVTSHIGENPRYTMSFNAFPSGFIGTRTNGTFRKFMNISVQQDN
jgi:uncharacterized protein (TIGR02466 family)